MGDTADMMLDGTLCEGRGVFLNSGSPGYPCYCSSCRLAGHTDEIKAVPKTRCPICNKKVKTAGLSDHRRDAHSAHSMHAKAGAMNYIDNAIQSAARGEES